MKTDLVNMEIARLDMWYFGITPRETVSKLTDCPNGLTSKTALLHL